ncbi:MAG: hypothetical protein MJ215_00380 [Spirochaetia bacterium]|nr:hypothetical protein [Spirochaetia bacterium]
MKKIFIFIAVLILVTGILPAKESRFKINPKVEFSLDDSDVTGDKYYLEYELEGELEVKYNFTDRLAAILNVELSRHDVDVEEISVLYDFDEYNRIKGGLFDSSLVMEDFLKEKYEIFHYDSPGVMYIKELGYTSNNTGIEYKSRRFLAEKIGFDAAFFFNPSHNETQFFLTGYYNFEEERNFISLTASYLPYVVHNVALGGSSEYKYNNFIFDLKYFNDTEHFVYTAEASIGSNLIDPVGYLHFPGEEDSWFAAADAGIGYNFQFSKFTYTPALRCGILCPDIKYMDENRRLDLMLGNYFHGKYIFVHLEGGFRFDTYDKGDGVKTDVDPIWGISFCLRS